MSKVAPQDRTIRRVVTGHNEAGQSCIISDAAATAVRTLDIRPGFQAVNIWRTVDSPENFNAQDTITDHVGVAPPSRGTILRIIDIPPEPKDPEALRLLIGATFGQHFDDAQREFPEAIPKHPGMHRTASVDYALIIEGEIIAVLDNDETLLKAGDVLIQRGTNHAWANRSDQICRIAFILIDAKNESA